MNWDALLIHVPAEICGPGGYEDSVTCLSDENKQRLEDNLQKNVDAGYLVPGADYITTRPGSYIVFVREYCQDDGTWHGAWYRYVFCEWWWSPTGKFTINFYPQGNNDDYGSCYVTTVSQPRADIWSVANSTNATELV